MAACLEVFCLGETVAVPLFVELRRQCTVLVARQALDRIVKDEVRHRQFGWDLLDYLLDREPALTDKAQSLLPEAFTRLDARYGKDFSQGATEAERAWGLMAPWEYARILSETVETQYRPRFEELGLQLPLSVLPQT
jgi:1,2-phenylacetyl-CoA epoxidase catalytic subunit